MYLSLTLINNILVLLLFVNAVVFVSALFVSTFDVVIFLSLVVDVFDFPLFDALVTDLDVVLFSVLVEPAVPSFF